MVCVGNGTKRHEKTCKQTYIYLIKEHVGNVAPPLADQGDASRLPQLIKELNKLGGVSFLGGTNYRDAD